MKFTSKTLGMEVSVDVPDSMEELDELFGKKGTAFEAALRYFIYHQWNPKFRLAFSDALAEESGISRQQLEKDGVPQFAKPREGEEQGAPIMESEQVHINRVLADGFSEEDAQALASRVAAEIPLEPSASRVRKPLARHKTAAKVIMAGVENGDKAPEDFIDKFEALNGIKFASVGNGEWDEETIALAIRVNEERLLKNTGGDFL